MKFKGTQKIFPTTLWGFEYDGDLTPYIKMLYHMRDYKNMGKFGDEAAFYSRGSWQSPELTQIEEFNDLFANIGKSLAEAMISNPDDRPMKQIKFKEAWGNINPTGTNIGEHLHIGSDYSGILYLQATEKSGNINFRDPRVQYEVVFQTIDFSVTPYTGRCVVFPSWLRHSVDINRMDQDRIGIAFNINVK